MISLGEFVLSLTEWLPNRNAWGFSIEYRSQKTRSSSAGVALAPGKAPAGGVVKLKSEVMLIAWESRALVKDASWSRCTNKI